MNYQQLNYNDYNLIYKNNKLIKIFSESDSFVITFKTVTIIPKEINDISNKVYQLYEINNKKQFLLIYINYYNQNYKQIKITYDDELNIKTISLDSKNVYSSKSKLTTFVLKLINNELHYYFKKTNILYQKHFNFDLITQTYSSLETYLYSNSTPKILLLILFNYKLPSLFDEYEDIKTIINEKSTLTTQLPVQYQKMMFNHYPRNRSEFDKIDPFQRYPFIGHIQNLKITPSLFESNQTNIEFTLIQIENDEIIDSILVKIFPKFQNEKIKSIKVTDFIEFIGNIYLAKNGKVPYVKFLKLINLSTELIIPKNEIKTMPRIEFSTSSNFSSFDGLIKPKELIDECKNRSYKSITITDKNSLYAYPDFYKYSNDIKINYGITINYIDDSKIYLNNPDFLEDFNLFDQTYSIFDFETTGLYSKYDDIIEIACIKIKNNKIIDKFSSFIKPNKELKPFISDLTNISNEWLSNENKLEIVLPKFLSFVKNTTLIAHNIVFDISFLEQSCLKCNLNFENYSYIDTLSLSRYLFESKISKFNLKALAKYLKIPIINKHRALFDVETTLKIFISLLEILKFKNIINYLQLNIILNSNYKYPSNLTLICKNQQGYRDLKELVSVANTDDFYLFPRFHHSKLEKIRNNLLIGSSNIEGVLFQTALNKNDDELLKVINFCDYIEIPSLHSCKHIINELGKNGGVIIKEIIQKIIHLSQQQNKLIIIINDVKYLELKDKKYYDVLVNTQQTDYRSHYLTKYEILPDNHFSTTEELIKEFQFLNNNQLIENLIINNPNKLNEQIEKIEIFPKELHSLADNEFQNILNIPSINLELRKLIKEKMTLKYGKRLHPIIKERIIHEAKSIVGINDQKPLNSDIATIYFLSYLLIQESKTHNEIIGSRGSVGSSLIAYLLEITEINPLKAYYLCLKCKFVEFPNDFNNHGFDLLNKKCPNCNISLLKDGNNISFETFLGFKGDKIPDIDLNFSSNYQKQIHQYLINLLGKDKVFKVGTISTIAERTSIIITEKYFTDREIRIRPEMIKQYSKHLEGIFKTTGQHPGGLVVVPKNKSIYDITPIQYPWAQIYDIMEQSSQLPYL